jgi:hypothetical protein
MAVIQAAGSTAPPGPGAAPGTIPGGMPGNIPGGMPGNIPGIMAGGGTGCWTPAAEKVAIHLPIISMNSGSAIVAAIWSRQRS